MCLSTPNKIYFFKQCLGKPIFCLCVADNSKYLDLSGFCLHYILPCLFPFLG